MLEREGRIISSYPKVKGHPKMTTQSYVYQADSTPCLSPMDARKADMLGYIRRKYNVPDHRGIVIKQGFITKDETEHSACKTWPFVILPPGVTEYRRPGENPEMLRPVPDPVDVSELPNYPPDFVGPSAYYEIVPSGNGNMCARCEEMAGRVYFAPDYIEGVTAPPFLPNCGCSTREYRGREEEGGEPGEERLPIDIANEILDSDQVIATRADERGKPNERIVEIKEHEGTIAYTSLARSCDDGILTDEQRANSSRYHQDSLSYYNNLGLNPYEVPYVVLPYERGNQTFLDQGIKLGDVVAVIYNGQLVFGIYIDNGPADRIGEVSMRIQEELFGNSNPRVGHDEYDVTYIVFPGSRDAAFGTNPGKGEVTYDAIQEIGQRLWSEHFG